MTVSAPSARPSVSPALSLSDLLDELGTVVMRVPHDRYVARHVSGVSGSVGEHIRHCLDHIAALVVAGPQAVLSYDQRQRGTAVETDPSAALREIMRLRAALERWSRRALDQPIRVTFQLSASGDSITATSTFEREFAFVISHTIHHQATLALLLVQQGVWVPDRFGHAPSTPHRH